jgi:hypothetical protein
VTAAAPTLTDPLAGFPVLAVAVIAVVVWLANRPVRPRPLVGPPHQPRAWRLRPGRQLDHDQPRPVRTPQAPPRAPWRQGGLDASRAVVGAARPQMPAPARPLSPRYMAYMDGVEAGDSSGWGGWTWPEKREAILAWYARRTGGACLLALPGYCTGQATQLDHCGRAAGDDYDYSELFKETPRTVRPVCRGCHVRREELKGQGIDAWRLVEGRSRG